MARKKTTSSRKTSKRTSSRRASRKPSGTRGGTRSRRGTGSRRKTSRRRASNRKKPQRTFNLNLEQKALIMGLGVIFITAVLVLSLLSPNQGQLTSALSGLMWRAFGWGGYAVPLIIGALGLYLVFWGMEQPPALPTYRLLGFGLLFLAFESLASLVQVMRQNGLADVWQVAQTGTGGGYLGGLFAFVLMAGIGTLGAILTLTVVGLIATILLFGVSRADLGQFLADLRAKPLPRPTGTAVPAADRDIRINPGRQPRQAPLPLNTAPEPEPTPEPKPERKRGRRSSRKETKPTPPAQEPTVATPVFLGNVARRGAGSWSLPQVAELLESGTDQDLNNAAIREQVEVIEHTLESFGAPATIVEINQGPAVTQFGVEPLFIEQRSGKRTKVKVGKIASLADDLALALAAQSIRIQAPVPGKGYVGIEVPNVQKSLVSLRDVMESGEFQKIAKKSPLTIGLGQNVAGQPIAADLASMPHLLIAGTTGSGKSVCVNGIIACLLLQNTPDELKIVMVDPKRVELTGYNGIPHLAAPVVVDMDRVIGTLQWAMREMDNRYKMFADMGARNINDYNKKIKRRKDVDPLPYIVIIIDELADLMMLSPEETERGVTRLAQMARATGIHMVIATQRPSVDVVTGLIKANFPARIAFAVASSTDSRVILDTSGAERLLGQGDMLFQSPDAAAPRRLQGCFVSEPELAKLIGYWQRARRFNYVPVAESAQPRPPAAPSPQPAKRETAVPPAPVPPPTINLDDDAPTRPTPAIEELVADDREAVVQETEDREGVVQETAVPPPTPPEPEPQPPLWEELQKAQEEAVTQAQHEDELMPKAIALVREMQKASTSLLQRRFRVGYTRAARMIDAMEEMGIIGPPTGTSKARAVLLPKEEQPEAAKE